MKPRQDERKPSSFGDRCGIALLYGLGAFVTALVLWLVFLVRLSVPFDAVWWFTGSVALVGFVYGDGPVLRFLEKIWHSMGRGPWPS